MRSPSSARVARVRAHDQRHLGRDRGPERCQVCVASARRRSIVAGPKSVLVSRRRGRGSAWRWPRRRPPASRRPRPWSAGAARAGSVEKARPASAAPGTLGTSATGASVTLMPAGGAPARRPGRRAPVPAAPARAAGGAQATLRMSPPSWSVQTIGIAPAALPASRSAFVSARSWPRRGDVGLNRIAPEAQPRAQHAAHVGRRGRALEAQHDELADLLLEVSSSTGSGVGVGVGEGVPSRGRRLGRLGARPGRHACGLLAARAEATPPTNAAAATASTAARRRRTTVRGARRARGAHAGGRRRPPSGPRRPSTRGTSRAGRRRTGGSRRRSRSPRRRRRRGGGAGSRGAAGSARPGSPSCRRPSCAPCPPYSPFSGLS